MPKFRRVTHSFWNLHQTDLHIWSLGVMVFFHALFDGMVGFVVPILILASGFSKTEMGIIYASSSFAGAIFDLVLSKYLRNVNFRRLYLFNFIACLFFPIVLFQSKTIPMFLLAMALWGLYYDLLSFGNFNFIGRYTPKITHATSFGKLDIFRSLGLLFAPLFAGIFVDITNFTTTLLVSLGILASSFLAYLALLLVMNKQAPVVENHSIMRVKGFWEELKVWKRLWKYVAPVLIFFAFVNVVDSFIWAVGPLLSEELAEIHPFGGVLLTFYFLPALFVWMVIGKIVKRWGKKRTAYGALFIGSIFLTLMSVAPNPVIIIFLILGVSFSFAIGWPAIRGAVADYISERETLESDIEGVSDFSSNIGYVIGPVLAGFSADILGNQLSFSVIGVFGILLSVFLFLITPRSINLPNSITSKL